MPEEAWGEGIQQWENIMARVGFIGVGNMGSLMARNLIKAGHSLKVYDVSEEAMNFVVQSGAKRAASVQDAAKGVDFVVTMLPVGANVRTVFLGEGVIAAADKGTVLIDSSTIDVDSARAVHAAAAERDRGKAEEEMKTAGVDTLDAIRARFELAQARIAVARRCGDAHLHVRRRKGHLREGTAAAAGNG